ncbi:MAG: nitroreductase family protein [Deltaproteobacteria bacterium]|nr:nitroreductase family protein [Deltaproteobacteria bacterium]
MELLTIDETRCKQDGICVMECPMSIIRLREKNSFPEMVPGTSGICLKCGHCVAVCPHDALRHQQIPIEDSPPLQKNLLIDEDMTIQFLRSRRSIRVFKDQPVERERLKKLINIASYAPTARNAQSVEWIAITEKNQVRRLSELVVNWMSEKLKADPNSLDAPYIPMVIAAWKDGVDMVLRNAPALLVASAPQESINGLVDVTINLTYLELAALSMGLGTCWAGMFKTALNNCPSLKEIVGIPARHSHFYAMMIGYPKFKYYRLPARKLPQITWREC